MPKKLQIAVVGCGYWGPNLIRNFSALPQCLVRYVCDKDEKRLAHMKQLYPQVETTKEFEKIVGDKDVDAVVVATPVHLHYELAKKALEAGKHAFVEKPMTQTSEQGNELVQLAAKKKLTLMVGHTFIYSAPVNRIQEIVKSGDIGEIQYISSRRLNLGLFQKDINVAVVGCGYWGPNLIRNFSALPECKVSYVCDKDEKRLAHMKQLYPSVEPTKDFEKIVGDKEVDAVVVATPVHLHYELAKKALEAGKHTFVEKPMTQTSEQSNELVQIAAKKKLTLMVGHTFIYSAPVRRIKEIVKSGDIGEVQYISSRRLNLGLFQKDINVAWDLAPHDISIILYFLGKPPISVNCQGKAHINKDI
ncbi:MAG TPA: Gfo/Idh/MocA family oxidoreductase, partial [Candidatus Deferrimicrobium sp.]